MRTTLWIGALVLLLSACSNSRKNQISVDPAGGSQKKESIDAEPKSPVPQIGQERQDPTEKERDEQSEPSATEFWDASEGTWYTSCLRGDVSDGGGQYFFVLDLDRNRDMKLELYLYEDSRCGDSKPYYDPSTMKIESVTKKQDGHWIVVSEDEDGDRETFDIIVDSDELTTDSSEAGGFKWTKNLPVDRIPTDVHNHEDFFGDDDGDDDDFQDLDEPDLLSDRVVMPNTQPSLSGLDYQLCSVDEGYLWVMYGDEEFAGSSEQLDRHLTIRSNDIYEVPSAGSFYSAGSGGAVLRNGNETLRGDQNNCVIFVDEYSSSNGIFELVGEIACNDLSSNWDFSMLSFTVPLNCRGLSR